MFCILLLHAPRQPGSSAYLYISGDNKDPSVLQHELLPATACAQFITSIRMLTLAEHLSPSPPGSQLYQFSHFDQSGLNEHFLECKF